MAENYGKGYVLGRQLFIELWTLLGLDAMVCNRASDFPACFHKLKHDDVAFVLVETEWFKDIPEYYKRKIKSGDSPVWVEMPSLRSSVKKWE